MDPALPVAAPVEGGVHDDLGDEDGRKVKRVYLVTFSHPTLPGLRSPGEFAREGIRDVVLQAVEGTQGPRCTPLRLQYLAVFQEKHGNGEVHYHVALLADRSFRFNALKQHLLAHSSLATHWSTSHDHYASCVAYGFIPSPKKPSADLDPEPLLWAMYGVVHPPLDQASRAPVTAKAIQQRREHLRKERAEAGKTEKFKAMDLWPIVIRENICPDTPGCADKVVAYATRCGGPAMVEFCFANYPKLDELVARSWRMQHIDEHVAVQEKPRMNFVEEACRQPCSCAGRWAAAASQLFALNGLSEQEWRQAVVQALTHGRSKGSLVCHVGKEGDEGKSFLLQPLYTVFGKDLVFTAPPKNAFPLLGLPAARLALLDDWRFNEDIVSYPTQLLWFEGKDFVIARPQNQYGGHLRYSKDDPVFLTTLEADLMAVHRGTLEGDRDMMLKRLNIFRFHERLDNPDRTIPSCAPCFSKFLLHPQSSLSAAQKRLAAGPLTPDRRDAATWDVDTVILWLHRRLHLGHLEEQFRLNGVDGTFLTQLSEEDLVSNLGLLPLQARKVVTNFRALQP